MSKSHLRMSWALCVISTQGGHAGELDTVADFKMKSSNPPRPTTFPAGTDSSSCSSLPTIKYRLLTLVFMMWRLLSLLGLRTVADSSQTASPAARRPSPDSGSYLGPIKRRGIKTWYIYFFSLKKIKRYLGRRAVFRG